MKQLTLLSAVFSLMLLSCSKDEPAEPTGSIHEVPQGNYMITEATGQTIINQVIPLKKIPVDTIPASEWFKPNLTILSVEKDSLLFFANADSVTTRSAFKKDDNLFTAMIDTAAIRKAALSAGVDLEIANYSMGKPFFTADGSAMSMKNQYQMMLVVTPPADSASKLVVKIQYEIIGDMNLHGVRHAGVVPPVEWPQNITNINNFQDQFDLFGSDSGSLN